jgi:hypothetical protein
MVPKIESLFKLNIGIVFGAHFWGPLLDISFGSNFFKNIFSELFRREIIGSDLNIQARAYNCRGRVFRRWVWF